MGPKHRMSVTAIGRCAAPITSRITPPTPVLDPPKGSIAEGWLCVSAFTAMVVPGENDTMPAFPTYALRRNGASIAVVAFRSCCNSGVIASPWSPVIRARKVLWAQCSLHVWASVSSSTSVGARPALRKCSAMACSSAGSSDRPRSRLRAASASSSSPSRSTSSTPMSAVASESTNVGSMGPIDHRSMTGLASSRLASTDMVSSSTSPCTS